MAASTLFSALALLPALALALGPTIPGGLPRPKPRATPKVPTGSIPAAQPRCETVTVDIPDVVLPPMLLAEGFTEVGGAPDVRVSTRLDPRGTALRMQGTVRVENRRGNVSSYVRHFSRVIPVLPASSRCVVTELEGPFRAEVEARVRDEHRYIDHYGTAYLDKAVCRADTNGDDDGKVHCRRLKFRSVRVHTAPAPDRRCRDAAVIIPPLTLPVVQHRRGDTEMDGNHVSLRIDASARHRGDRVLVDTRATFEEAVPDHTTFTARDSRVVFDAALDTPGCRVTGVELWRRGSGLPESRIRRLSGKNSHRPEVVRPDEDDTLIRYARCRTDTDGDDRGRLGCAEITYTNRLVVTLAER